MKRDDVNEHEVHLILEGRIVGAWADFLERESRELIRSGVLVVLDCAGVVFVARAGREALSRLAAVGVMIAGCSPLIAAVLEQEGIEVDRRPLNDRSYEHGV